MSTMSPVRVCAFALLLVLTAAGCQTSSSRIARIYTDLEMEVRDKDPVGLPAARANEVHRARADSVREIVEKDGLSDADDLFKAAVILVGTNRVDDMELAESLARKSAELGEPRAPRVVAEAVDKRAMLEGKPQKYGTQYAFEWVLDKWSLWPVDPMTTDGERSAMGVPTYAELVRAEDEMNKQHGKKRRED
jgi:hypothetical protein